MATPQVLSRKANGVLPVAAAQATTDAPKATKSKVPVDGEKVVIRRLPPGMTEDECIKLLGEDWKVGNGKVDWFSYQPGKISQDPSKPSRPARAYLHLKKREEALPLNEMVKTIIWEDAKDTYNSPSLIAPPAVELAIYKKVPSGKRRNDGRQGTIDQDQEFMDFLEGLANPTVATKEGEGGEATEEEGKSAAKATSTPLIDYLREKKANKAKDSSGSKSGKHGRQESQGGKGKGSAAAGDDSKKKSKESKSDKPKETVKILTKKQAAEAAAEAAKVVAGQLSGASTQEAPKSRRAGIAAAARILERDLGLSPGTAHRRARLEAAKQDAAKKTEGDNKASASGETPTPATTSATSGTSTVPSSAPTAPKSQAQESLKSSRGAKGKKQGASAESAKSKGDKSSETSAASKTPVILLKKKDEAGEKAGQKGTGTAASASNTSQAPPTGPKATTNKNAQASGSQKKGGQSQAPTPGATRAFVKHANPSQGVTEALLKEAMQAFGTITFVEIDRRKGFAYVDFSEHDGLVKAISASPISVADATVQVLERKETGTKKGAAAQSASSNGTATTSGSAAPTVSAEKGTPSTTSEHKRGGRRRGGRGRDTGPKEGAGKSADQAASTTAALTPAATSSAG